MTIKHMVLSGGGPTGLITYGAIKRLHEEGMWCLNKLESIYMSSIGSFIGFVIALGYDWNTVDEYLIGRPWNKTFSHLGDDLLEVMRNKGLDGLEMASICTEPLLLGKDLPKNVTLQELYEYTNVELCFIATDLNTSRSLHTEIITHKTYPNMSLNIAIAASSAFPLVFKPIFYNNKCFVDGGLLNNFPLNICLNNTKCKEDEMLAFCNYTYDTPKTNLTDESSYLDYARVLMRKCYLELETTTKQKQIKNIVYYDTRDVIDYTKWIHTLEDGDMRKTLIERGLQAAVTFMDLIQNQEIVEECPAVV